MGLVCTLLRHLSILIFIVSLFPDFSTAKQESVRDKAGQLFMIGFPQTELDSSLKQHILKNRFSSFILFKRNMVSTEQTRKLTSDLNTFVLKELNKPALIAIDQEGGAVSRIMTKPITPSASTLGVLNSEMVSYNVGKEIGRILRHHGVNMNLAPVLDVSSIAKLDFIGPRSFGSDPYTVGKLASSYARGLVDSKVLPTGKHFPGMSSIFEDPHQIMIESPLSLSELENVDLVPYRDFFQISPPTAVMISHIVYPKIDSSKRPGIFSKFITDTLLRERLGFSGLVITDDVQMQNGQNLASTARNALESIKAGADLVILSWSFRDQEKSVDQLSSSISTGSLSEELVRQKLNRIQQAKLHYKLSESVDDYHFTLKSSLLSQVEDTFERFSMDSLLSVLKDLKLNQKPSEKLCIYSFANIPGFKFTRSGNLAIHFRKLPSRLSVAQLGEMINTKSCASYLVVSNSVGGFFSFKQALEMQKKTSNKIYVNYLSLTRPSKNFNDYLDLLVSTWPGKVIVPSGNSRSFVQLISSRSPASNTSSDTP